MKNFQISDIKELEGFSKVCLVDNLKEYQGQKFFVNETEIAIFKVDGEIYALNNICPHQHTAMIYDGFIEDGCVVCPAHGWMFNLKTGRMNANRKGLDSYPVKIFENQVFVKVNKKEFNW